MQEIILDLETTGLNPRDGHRIVEIACLELRNYVPTGRYLRHYIDPERDMPEDAFRVHGLSQEFLTGKPRFGEIAEEILQFIGDAPLVIHNAEFDVGFLNAELALLGYSTIPISRAIDTLQLARRQFPGLPNSLDALCKRYNVDLSDREKHGALLDCELLAAVYLELRGGRQVGLGFAASRQSAAAADQISIDRVARPPRPHAPKPAELEAHRELVAKLYNPLWSSSR